ncbi:MAG: SDR family NAD(P)-dependent oxidoreductase [Pelobium sp.]
MNIKGINKIAVFGCGWLGLPLAKSLIIKGFYVKGSTTSVPKLNILATAGIAPFLVQVNPEISGDSIDDFFDVDLLIINIPPGRNTDKADEYGLKMQRIADCISNSSIHKVIFISSTSVYPETNQEVDENLIQMADSPSALRMLNAEKIFKNLRDIETTVIRMAGLIGPERHPGRFFAGKENIPNGLAPVNLIHLDDCIGVIDYVIEHKLWEETFNGVAPTHPTKSAFYDLASLELYQKNAVFIDELKEYKTVSAAKILHKGYQFKHPDLMKWLIQTPQN